MNVHAINTDSNTALHAIRMAARAPGADIPDSDDNLADSFPAENQPTTGVWNRAAFRQIYPYALFNKSPLQLRRIGALGGKAHGRNQRARRALMPTPPAGTPLRPKALPTPWPCWTPSFPGFAASSDDVARRRHRTSGEHSQDQKRLPV